MMTLILFTGAPDGAPPSGNAKSRTTRHRMTKTVSCDRNCSARRVFGTMLLCLIPMAAAVEDDLRGREATQEQRGERRCTASSRLRPLRSQQRRLTSVPVGPPFCVRGSRSSSSLRQSVLGASGAAANPEALAEPPAMGAAARATPSRPPGTKLTCTLICHLGKTHSVGRN